MNKIIQGNQTSKYKSQRTRSKFFQVFLEDPSPFLKGEPIWGPDPTLPPPLVTRERVLTFLERTHFPTQAEVERLLLGATFLSRGPNSAETCFSNFQAFLEVDHPEAGSLRWHLELESRIVTSSKLVQTFLEEQLETFLASSVRVVVEAPKEWQRGFPRRLFNAGYLPGFLGTSRWGPGFIQSRVHAEARNYFIHESFGWEVHWTHSPRAEWVFQNLILNPETAFPKEVSSPYTVWDYLLLGKQVAKSETAMGGKVWKQLFQQIQIDKKARFKQPSMEVVKRAPFKLLVDVQQLKGQPQFQTLLEAPFLLEPPNHEDYWLCELSPDRPQEETDRRLLPESQEETVFALSYLPLAFRRPVQFNRESLDVLRTILVKAYPKAIARLEAQRFVPPVKWLKRLNRGSLQQNLLHLLALPGKVETSLLPPRVSLPPERVERLKRFLQVGDAPREAELEN